MWNLDPVPVNFVVSIDDMLITSRDTCACDQPGCGADCTCTPDDWCEHCPGGWCPGNCNCGSLCGMYNCTCPVFATLIGEPIHFERGYRNIVVGVSMSDLISSGHFENVAGFASSYVGMGTGPGNAYVYMVRGFTGSQAGLRILPAALGLQPGDVLRVTGRTTGTRPGRLEIAPLNNLGFQGGINITNRFDFMRELTQDDINNGLAMVVNTWGSPPRPFDFMFSIDDLIVERPQNVNQSVSISFANPHNWAGNIGAQVSVPVTLADDGELSVDPAQMAYYGFENVRWNWGRQSYAAGHAVDFDAVHQGRIGTFLVTVRADRGGRTYSRVVRLVVTN